MKIDVDEQGRMLLTEEIMDELGIKNGEEVIFFEREGIVVVANAQNPLHYIVLSKPRSCAS